MEQKCLKTSVYSNDILYNDTTEQPIDVDFTLPDYCPDISKIFKCRAVSRISSKSINGKSISIDGSICITVLYCDQDNMLCSYEYLYPFNKVLQMSDDYSGADLWCHSKCDYINCRAVTGRKIDIHGAAGILIKVFRRKANEIISDIDDPNIESKRCITPATLPMGYSEKYLLVEEEIQIGQGQPAIQNILRYDAKTCVKESKIINDKIVVKGEMCVSVLYCPDNGGNAPQLVKTVIPFSQIVDMEGVTDTCECETKSEIAFLDIKPKSGVSGEYKCFSLTSKVLITCEAYCGNDIAVITDSFSRKYKADITRKNICFDKIVDNIKETFHCKKNIELDEPISSISDLWCDMQSVATKFENNCIIISGTVIAGMIACDTDSKTSYYEKPIDFEYKYELKNDIENMHCNPEIDVLSCGYTITSANNIELRADLSINATVYSTQTMSLIVDMDVDESVLNDRKTKGAMTIYFASQNECVWDIAKHYNSSVDEIMKINELDSEELSEGKMILIPVI